MSFLLIAIPNSVACLQSRKGFFIDNDIDPSTLQSSKTIELATIDVPSDLACSQKCFANELCSYKSYDSNSRKCQLYKEISSEDGKQLKRIARKVNVSLSSNIFIKLGLFMSSGEAEPNRVAMLFVCMEKNGRSPFECYTLFLIRYVLNLLTTSERGFCCTMLTFKIHTLISTGMH